MLREMQERDAERIEARRVRNREYMRVRRQDPKFVARQSQWKKRSGGKRCTFCGKRTAVEIVTRLRPANTKSGFEPIQVRYCGKC